MRTQHINIQMASSRIIMKLHTLSRKKKTVFIHIIHVSLSASPFPLRNVREPRTKKKETAKPDRS